MALKTILLRSKLDALNSKLEVLNAKDADFEAREAELTAAVEEMTAETPEEDRAVIEQKAGELDSEVEENENAKKTLKDEIADIERQIADEEEKQKAAEPVTEPENKVEEREKVRFKTMENRKSNFFGMSVRERDAFIKREDVQKFLATTREAISNKRDVTGADLFVPVVITDLIRENILDYSKLINRVRFRSVSGVTRQPVMGMIPEAVWTESCDELNELVFSFSMAQLDAFKIGGYVWVCNSTIYDSDIALLSELIVGIGQSIGLGIDKGILYGKGAAQKQPLGICTRLAQTSIPDDYPSNARPWVDLHSSHVLSITGTGATFFQNLVNAEAVCDGTYARGVKFWAMNMKTFAKIKANAVATNLYGAFVSEVDGVMPVVGGDIVVLNFIPDNDVICGYGELYLLAERQGTIIETDRSIGFIKDMTCIKGEARFDGTPVIAEAFALININNSSATTSLDFAVDNANDATLEDLQIAGAELSPTFDKATYTYTVEVANNVSSVSVYATPSQGEAEVTIKKGTKKYVDGAPVAITVGDNTITVEVKKGAAKLTYTVTVTRAGV